MQQILVKVTKKITLNNINPAKLINLAGFILFDGKFSVITVMDMVGSNPSSSIEPVRGYVRCDAYY